MFGLANSPEILYNIRKKELEKMILDVSVQRWTEGAINCYKRGCVCKNCPVKNLITSQKCQMKSAVIELVKKFGIPQK